MAQTTKNPPVVQETWVGKILWRRERLATPVFWPGEFHRQRSLVGYSPQGHKEWTWLSNFHFYFTFFKVRKATTNADLLPQLVYRYEQVTLEILLFRFKDISKVKICCSVTQSCPTLCNLMDCSTPDFPVLRYLPEFAQTHAHWVSDVIKISQPLPPHSPLALNLSQHQGLFQWVNSLDQVAKISELQLYHQSFQWISSVQFSCSVLSIPMNTQCWFPLELTGLILLSKGLSTVFFTTVRKHQFFGTQPSLWSNFHICTWVLKTIVWP